VVGRQAPFIAALLVAFGADLALGAIAAVSLVAYGLPVAGSVAFGLSWAVFGWAFAALAAAVAQATEGARAARGISIAVLAACALLKEFGRPLELSKRVLDLSPFAHVPKLPADDVLAAPLMWLVLISAALVAVGLLGLRRRDVL
jgi:ABC-2 type transport system permease protein